MHRAIIYFAIFFGTALVASCKKSYVCRCSYPDNIPPYNADYKISARDHDEALERCAVYADSISHTTCSVQ